MEVLCDGCIYLVSLANELVLLYDRPFHVTFPEVLVQLIEDLVIMQLSSQLKELRYLFSSAWSLPLLLDRGTSLPSYR